MTKTPILDIKLDYEESTKMWVITDEFTGQEWEWSSLDKAKAHISNLIDEGIEEMNDHE